MIAQDVGLGMFLLSIGVGICMFDTNPPGISFRVGILLPLNARRDAVSQGTVPILHLQPFVCPMRLDIYNDHRHTAR